MAGAAWADSAYRVSFAEASAQQLRVELHTACPAGGLTLVMPAWSATYQLRDFAQHVLALEAKQRDTAVAVRKTSLTRWRAACTVGSDVDVAYELVADRAGPFGAYVDANRATLNLAQVLMYPPEARFDPFSLRLVEMPKSWRAALSLPEEAGVYRAASYDRLVDTPVLLGRLHIDEFRVGGKLIRVASQGDRGTHNRGLLRDSAERVAKAAQTLMGELPFDTYTFAIHFGNGLGGGMEFRDGTLIGGPVNCERCDMAGLIAHEFFHLWNVKRLRAKLMEPVDFEQPVDTSTLWFAEGVTSTYAHYLMLLARLESEQEFLDHVGESITTYESRPASRSQSAEQSGLEAWFERHAAYGRADRSVSYYLQGELVGYLLDLEIRGRSGNRSGLDDVMRYLAREYGDVPYAGNEGLMAAIHESTGLNMDAEFKRLVQSSEEVDWGRYLARAGYELAVSTRDTWSTGLTVANAPDQGPVVSAVEARSPAAEAGVQTGDEVLAVGDLTFRGDDAAFAGRVADLGGEAVEVILRRDGEELAVTLKPVVRENVIYRLHEVSRPTEEQLSVRRGWLERRTTRAVVGTAHSGS